MFHQQQKVRKW